MAGETQLSEIGESISESVTAQVETVTEIADAAIENAEARAEAAQETAEAIASAVYRDALSRDIHETQRRIEEWLGQKDQEIAQQSQLMAEFQASLSSLSEQLAAMAGLTLGQAMASPEPQMDQSSSNQETLAEAILPEQSLDPSLLNPGDVAASPAQAVAKRVRRLI